MRFTTALALLPILASAAPTTMLARDDGYMVFTKHEDLGPNDLLNWNFFNGDDPTHGWTNYLTADEAKSKGYARVEGNVLKLSSGPSTSPRGRDSVRITGPQKYDTNYLLVFDVEHMPVGTGLFPALWTNSEGQDWPQGGEIDIIEGGGFRDYNSMTIHTQGSCKLLDGQMKYVDAEQGKDGARPWGHTQFAMNPQTYGRAFNAAQGGQYMLLVADAGLQIFFVPRDQQIDLGDSIGTPTEIRTKLLKYIIASWEDSWECRIRDKFYGQNPIINLAICGGIGNAEFKGGAPECFAAVQNIDQDPNAWSEAYWAIRGFKSYMPSN